MYWPPRQEFPSKNCRLTGPATRIGIRHSLPIRGQELGTTVSTIYILGPGSSSPKH